MRQRERHAPSDKQSLRVIAPQYSAHGRAYDFRGKIACKCLQPHDMVNLIASAGNLTTTKSLIKWYGTLQYETPLFGFLDQPIIEKTV